MADVWLGRFNRWVEKLFNAKGGPTVLDVDPGIQVTLPLHPVAAEERYLQGWGRYAGANQVTGGAAQFGQMQLRNPVGSNVVAVVEKLSVTNFTTPGVSVGLGIGPKTTDLTTISAAAFRIDTRANPLPTCILSLTTNGVNPTSGQWQIGIPAAGTTYDFIITVNQEISLMPGDALLFFDNNTAQLSQKTFQWRERALEQSELT